MTNITTIEKALQTTAEAILAKEGYTKTFYAEGIGGMWKRGNTVIDVTVHAGHQNTLMVIEPYIVVRIFIQKTRNLVFLKEFLLPCFLPQLTVSTLN